MNRRRFLRNAAGLLVPAFAPNPIQRALAQTIIVQGPARFPAAGGGVAPTVGNLTSKFDNGANSTIDTPMASNVTNGRLVVFSAFSFEPTAIAAYTAAMVTKLSGTATIGTVQLDVTTSRADGGAANRVGIWSIPVTGSGSLTLRLAAGGSGHFISTAACEVALVDVSGTRVDGSTATANGSTNTSIASGNVTTGGAGIIFGVCTPGNPYGTITLTEDGAFSKVAELEDDSSQNGSLIYRPVSAGTTDSADWTAGTSCAWCAGAVPYKAATP